MTFGKTEVVFSAAFLLNCIAPLCGAAPDIGAHTLAYYTINNQKGGSGLGITTSPINTQATGSTILALVARGDGEDFTGTPSWAATPATNVPTDNKGNAPIAQLGTTQTYGPAYPTSGEALFAWQNAIGGTGQTFHEPMLENDEITFSAVEVTNGGLIEGYSFVKVISPAANTSMSVRTTGPATLVAYWLGDSGASSSTATPNNGFTEIDSETISSDAVETAVAYKDVSTAGTYSVSWSETPAQGAHLWLVAVQTIPEPTSFSLAAAMVSTPLLRRRRGRGQPSTCNS